ncbi:hypothetical protein NDR87_05755 [Nocardia sp. CDC159]|uniref:Lipoprotein LpqE n=1 Tax=Nocardia pulmonis TaxID=2951408 RepID=A0A9X2E382_9NOCA|nr:MULTISPECIES: hypothetical protein [Nocardia]MCM6772835.1 hypothetical protein [Nocardia pulmonis]MCM6785862.1 hypothetical protein [Nocardia sp. CDC159]
MTALKATTASKARRHAVTVAAFAAGAVLALSGCSAGQISQTADQVAAVNGNSADVGQVALRNVRLLLPPSEEYNNAKGGKAVLAFSAVNGGSAKADELTSITSDLGTVKITPANPQLPPGATVVADAPKPGAHVAAPTTTAAPTSAAAPTSSPAASTAAASSATAQQHGDHAAPAAEGAAGPLLVEVTGLTKDVTPGLTYQVTFNFKDAGTVAVNVPVDAGPDLGRKDAEKAGEKAPAHSGGH